MVFAAGSVPVFADDRSFDATARPVLKAMCFHCHGEEEKPKGKLDLRLVRSIRKGGATGPAIEPGKRDESLLWERIAADEMPPGPKKLTPAQKAAIGDWIDAGAPSPPSEPETLPPGPSFSEVERNFWAFRPIVRVESPTVKATDKVRTPVDAFVLAALEVKGLSFSPEADRPTLIRRVAFDLTGLPPSSEDVAAFVTDTSPLAYEHVVERLLASPSYGERWARHWMDAAGYADSDGGSSRDDERKYAYKYRDWLIRSLNADRRWDELIREQLAGDEMLKPPYQDLPAADLDKLTATGFLRLAPDATADPAVDPMVARNEVVADTIKVVSTSMLGLTVGCAQCHVHRYDPISQEDYFRLRAIFEPALDPSEWRVPSARLISLWTEADRKKAADVDAELGRIEKERIAALEVLVTAALDRELAAAPEALRAKLRESRDAPAAKRTDEQKSLLKDYPRILVSLGNISLYDAKGTNEVQNKAAKRSDEVRKKRPPEDFVHALTEVPGKIPKTKLHHRGDPKQPKQEIAPGELSVLATSSGSVAIADKDPTVPTSGRRLAYAKHLTKGKHPLLARVFVNRVWMNHFGRGLVATPGDFGILGQRPSHPELLDRLAADFMADGWSLKNLHRTMVLSTTYRQSSARSTALDAVDSDNRLLGRMSIRRLEAEEIRDAMLAVSGRLNSTMFGPPVPVALTNDGKVELGIEKLDGNGHRTADTSTLAGGERRRSLYIQVRRTRPVGLLDVFDAPGLSPNCEVRNVSTVATQSLLMLNDRFTLDSAEALSQRAGEGAVKLRARIARAWTLAYGTEPETSQVDHFEAFVNGQSRALLLSATADGKKPAFSTEARALATFCQALLASNRFLYVD
jgi:hypothetical protein